MKIPIKNRVDTQALPLESCLAKTYTKANGCCCAGRTVEEHCRIVGAVAQELLSRLSPAQQKFFPANSARPALTHDTGKVCPTFQTKIYKAVNIPLSTVPELNNGHDPSQEKEWGGHAAVSFAELHLMEDAPHMDEIVGQHHGFSTGSYPAKADYFGGEAWHARRQELLKKLLQGSEYPIWPNVNDAPETIKCISGLTIVADWIGSGPLFDAPDLPWKPLVARAVDEAGFIPPRLRPGLSFEDIFSFSPREIQTHFVAHARQPGVYILEAPMGLGKTEAALYAAYRLMECGASAGVYFALPTQLTSDSMHTRFEAFLQKILVPDDGHHAMLLHSKAWLTHFLRQDMGEDAAPGGTWFHGSKRGILAPFAVGTVDQALMAAMHVRHSAVRVFGLVGKTVILDEVHSYDAYTGTLLDALVTLLRRCGCTVIILSATLTAERRSAFTGGISRCADYPLISASTDTLEEIPCRPPTDTIAILGHVAEDAALEESLLRAEQGQQVLWIENTVSEAQQCYLLFSARAASINIPVGLLHSRFTQADRTRNEGIWTALYGKNAATRQKTGRILIGTQVLEQSLDIDADFLVTRFCPTDMLLQRLGRLWRHTSTPRPPEARREAWLLHPPLEDALNAPHSAFGSTGNVYAPYVLCRSLALWHAKTQVTLPTDIRPLLEDTYATRMEESPAMTMALQEVKQEREKLRNIALHGIATDGSTQCESCIQTRAGQHPTVDVLLLRSLDRQHGEAVLADGTTVQLAGDYSWGRRQKNAAHLSLNIVRVPEYLAPEAATTALNNEWLTPWLHCVDKNAGKILVRVALVDYKFSLYDLSGNEIPHTSYRPDYGYLTE